MYAKQTQKYQNDNTIPESYYEQTEWGVQQTAPNSYQSLRVKTRPGGSNNDNANFVIRQRGSRHDEYSAPKNQQTEIPPEYADDPDLYFAI